MIYKEPTSGLTCDRDNKIRRSNGKLFEHQDDRFLVHDGDTGFEKTLKEIRQEAKEFYENIDQEPEETTAPQDKLSLLQSTIAKFGITTGTGGKIATKQPETTFTEASTSEIIDVSHLIDKIRADRKNKSVPAKSKIKPQSKPEKRVKKKFTKPNANLNTQKVTEHANVNTKKQRKGSVNAKFNGYYHIPNHKPFDNARDAAKAYGKSVNTTISHCKLQKNGCSFQPK